MITNKEKSNKMNARKTKKDNVNTFVWFIIVIIAIILTAVITKFIIESGNDNAANDPNKRKEQLNTVLEACTNNEDSARCKELQQKYNVTFRYCRSIKNPDGSYADLDTIMSTWYPMVWEGTSSDPPEAHMTINGNDRAIPSNYYGCSEHMK